MNMLSESALRSRCTMGIGGANKSQQIQVIIVWLPESYWPQWAKKENGK